MAVQKKTEPKTQKKVFCDKCGQEIKGFQPCADRKKHVCDNCCEKCYNAGGGTCKAYERRKAWIEHERQEFITFMGNVGFRRSEAVKMADFALLDFGSYQEAFEYYSRNEKFLSGWAAYGDTNSRKARRLFRIEEPKMRMIDQQHAAQQYRNAVNNAQGHSFEGYIKAACALYSQQGRAEIDKTPEPFRVTAKDRKNGTFSGRFTARAQPDFQGTLDGGRSIVFEAKYTTTDRMKRAAVTDEQMKCLQHHHERGALAAVCVGIQNNFFFVPWLIWDDMKNLFKRQYVTADDLQGFRVKFNGSVLFLDYVGQIGGRWIEGADCSPDRWRTKGGAKGE